MYYSDDLVEEIRAKNDIVDVIAGYVRLQKKGSSYFGLCPFHNEKSPSFSVTPAKQLYYCFGCGAGGNVFTFLMEYENFNFQEALQTLAERAGVLLPTEEEENNEARKNADLKSILLKIQKEAALYFYHNLMSEHGEKGLSYLKERHLTMDTIKRFGLGYSNKKSDDLYVYLKNKGYKDSILKESGLVTIEERGAHDKFWNRVMYPILDVRSKAIGFGGRVMGEGEPKYLNSPETKIFDKSRNLYGLNFARTSKRPNLIICEGYMDVIALHQAGFDNAVASLGTAFTSQQASLLKRYTKEVLLTYDSDGAGMKASLRALPILKQAGLRARVIDMRPYKDPDEFLSNLGAHEFEKRIEQASNSFLYEVNAVKQKYDMKDPEQKTKFYNEVAGMLLGFPEELERNNYIEAVSKELSIRFEALNSLVNKLAYQTGGQPVIPKAEIKSGRNKTNKETGIRHSQKLLLTWMIEDISLFEKLKGVISPKDFTEEMYHMVAKMLFEEYEREGKVTPARIISRFSTEEEQREANALFNTSLDVELTIKEREKALNETVKKIKAYWCEYASSRATDFKELEEISQVKRSLQDLHISLG